MRNDRPDSPRYAVRCRGSLVRLAVSILLFVIVASGCIGLEEAEVAGGASEEPAVAVEDGPVDSLVPNQQERGPDELSRGPAAVDAFEEVRAAERGWWFETPESVQVQVVDDRVADIEFPGGFPLDERSSWERAVGASWVVGDFHATDVVPRLWRRLDVELEKSDGSAASVTMLRPLWWFDQTGAEEGGTIALELGEAEIEGDATVVAVADDVTIDSRADDGAVVTGTIRHDDAPVIRLEFDGDDRNSVGVTASHPLKSADRDRFVPAGDLAVGEGIETLQGGSARVTRVVPSPRTESVYNLEVHRAKSYYVASQALLAHNTCFDNTIDYLRGRAASAVDEADLIQILVGKDGLRFRGGSRNGKHLSLEDAAGNIRARIDPPDEYGGRHLHLYDASGNSLDAAGNIVPRKSADAHIRIE